MRIRGPFNKQDEFCLRNWQCLQLLMFQLWCVLSCRWRLLVWPSLLTASPFWTLSLLESQFVYVPWSVFSTQAFNGKSMFNLFVKIFFDYNMFLHPYHTFFCKFLWVCTSQLLIIWWQTSVQAWSTPFEPLNNIFCVIKLIFTINQFHTMQSLHLGKKFWEKKFILLFFNPTPIYSE